MTSQNPLSLILIHKQVYSKNVSPEVSTEISKDLAALLGRECGMEHVSDDVAPWDTIGTFHQYRSKLEIPDKADLQPEDIPKQRDTCLIEIRKYNRRTQKDNRAVLIMSTSEEDFKAVSGKVADFYKNMGYEQIQFKL